MLANVVLPTVEDLRHGSVGALAGVSEATTIGDAEALYYMS